RLEASGNVFARVTDLSHQRGLRTSHSNARQIRAETASFSVDPVTTAATPLFRIDRFTALCISARFLLAPWNDHGAEVGNQSPHFIFVHVGADHFGGRYATRDDTIQLPVTCSI